MIKLIASLFRAKPKPLPRDNDGRFLPHRVAVRKKSIELATEMGRADLVARISGEYQ